MVTEVIAVESGTVEVVKVSEEEIKIIDSGVILNIGATQGLTGAEIKAAYEAEDDTNAFTDAEKQTLSDLAAKAFLQNPDLTDFIDSLYFYFGWENVNGGWLIQRQLRADGASLGANESSNELYTDLTSAWANKGVLSYA